MTENEELRQEIERLALERDQLRETVESQKALGLNVRQWFAGNCPSIPDWYSVREVLGGPSGDELAELRFWCWREYFVNEMCKRFHADHIADASKMVTPCNDVLYCEENLGAVPEGTFVQTPGGASIASEPDPSTLPRCSKCNRVGAKSIEGRMLCVTCYHEELP